MRQKRITQGEVAEYLAMTIVLSLEDGFGLRKCLTKNDGTMTLVLTFGNKTSAKRSAKRAIEGSTLFEALERWMEQQYGEVVGDNDVQDHYDMMESVHDYVIGKEITTKVFDGGVLEIIRTPLIMSAEKVVAGALGTVEERKKNLAKEFQKDFDELLSRVRAKAEMLNIDPLKLDEIKVPKQGGKKRRSRARR